MDPQSRTAPPPSATAVARLAGDARRYLAICQDLALRDFRGRYRGNLSGVAGLLIVPIAFLATSKAWK